MFFIVFPAVVVVVVVAALFLLFCFCTNDLNSTSEQGNRATIIGSETDPFLYIWPGSDIDVLFRILLD